MDNKRFIYLLAAALIFGGVVAGAFVGGIAVGNSNSDQILQSVAPLQTQSQSGQQLPGQFAPGTGDQGQFGQGSGTTGFGSGGFAGCGGLVGIIEKIEGNTITINTSQGPLNATMSDDTVIQEMVSLTSEDLQNGLRVTVIGQRGEDGTVSARSIVITPEGVESFLGGGFSGGGFGGSP